MEAQILPLAITMVAGPQIISAVILTTSKRAVPASLAYIAGVAVAVSVGIVVFSYIGELLSRVLSLHTGSGPSTASKIIQLILVGFLAFLTIKTYRNRQHIEPPKWMGSLQTASPRKAFILGLLLIFLMPTDIITMLTVGINLRSNNLPLTDAIPFILLTVALISLPLGMYLVFYRRASTLMPKIRGWLNAHSWTINMFVYLLFIYLILS